MGTRQSIHSLPSTMFSKQPEISLADLSIDLRDHDDWSVGALKAHDIPLDITTLAIEPIARVLAIGWSQDFMLFRSA